MVISLKKKTAEWWDAFSKDKSYKRFIKTDFSKWCEEEDREYMGDFGPADDMGGMGGMGGMDFGAPPHESNRGGSSAGHPRWHEHRSSLSRARRHAPHAVLLHAGGMGMGGMGMDGMGGMGNFGDSDDVPPQ